MRQGHNLAVLLLDLRRLPPRELSCSSLDQAMKHSLRCARASNATIVARLSSLLESVHGIMISPASQVS